MKAEKSKGMIDNCKVKDNHQQGISRVSGVGKNMDKGKGGKLGAPAKADYSRGAGQTPRRA